MLENEVLLTFRGRGFPLGDAEVDSTRTLAHHMFKLPQHVEPLFRSLPHVQIDRGVSPAEMCFSTDEVFERNRPLRAPEEDCWISQRTSQGVLPCDGEKPVRDGPTNIVECTPLPLRQRARPYNEGSCVVAPSTQHTPPEALSAPVKITHYLTMIVSDHETTAVNPGAWAVLLDMHESLADGRGSSIHLAKDGRLAIPHPNRVLLASSGETEIELAVGPGIPCEEADINVYDAYDADGAFLTSTSLCICPVRSINGSRVESERVFGTISRQLVEAYVRLVDCDFVALYRPQLD